MAQATAGSEAPEEKGLTDRQRLQISLLRNGLYHDDREQFFATAHRWIMAFVIVGGVLTVASFMQQWPALIAVAGTAVTIIATLDLAFDLDGHARLHAALKHRVYALLAQSEDSRIPVHKLREQAALIYADEPPCMHAANAVAYNSAMEAFGRPKEYLFVVSAWQRFWRNLRAYTPADFRTVEEIEAAKHAI